MDREPGTGDGKPGTRDGASGTTGYGKPGTTGVCMAPGTVSLVPGMGSLSLAPVIRVRLSLASSRLREKRKAWYSAYT